MFITTDGDIYGCGRGQRGQLGHELRLSFPSPTPISVPFEPDSVYCGHQFSVIKATDGTLWSTGQNLGGQLGLGDREERTKFTQIPELVCTQVACGREHVIAIDAQCRLWGWGANESHQLSSLTEKTVTPTLLRENIVTALTGNSHTLALTTDNQVMACGLNNVAQLANGTTSERSDWVVSHITSDMMQIADGKTSKSRAKSARSVAHN